MYYSMLAGLSSKRSSTTFGRGVVDPRMFGDATTSIMTPASPESGGTFRTRDTMIFS
jgi:hypothetical protein